MLSESFKNIEKNFEKWKEHKNYKELSSIQPRILAKELDISEYDANNFLDDLVDEGQALRVFTGICPNEECEEEFFIDNSQVNEKYQCDICGTSFKITDDSVKDIEVYYELIQKSDTVISPTSINYKKKYFSKEVDKSKENIFPIQYPENNNVIDIKETLNNKCVGDNRDIDKNINHNNSTELSIFISHNEADGKLAEIIIQLLEELGVSKSVKDGKIFCSSSNDRGVMMGDDIFEVIKNKFDDNIIILFLFTEKFFQSPASLCEMGAAWVKSKNIFPLVVPPQRFEDIKGIFNKNIKGYMLNDEGKFLQLVDYFREKFGLPDIG